ncbi:MAG: protein kinase [Planctomycetes bacterium]|nr:protein kinase [Planctomycetota bacterium]
MAHEDDLFVAREAVQRGLINREQLQEALVEMYEQERASGGERWPLGVILVSSGHFPESVLLSLLAERVQPHGDKLTSSQAEDLDLGRLLVLTGTLEPEQVNAALALQMQKWKPGEPSKRVGEIVVEKGWATPEQVQRVLSYLRTAVMVCASCKRRYEAMKATPRSALRCPRCGGTLSRSRQLAFDESIRLLDQTPRPFRRVTPVPPAAASVGEQALIDHALALYLRQMSLVPPASIRDAQRIQLEMSRFGIEVALLDVMKRLNILTPRQASEIPRIDFASVVHGPGWTNQTVPGYKITRKIASGGTSTIFAAEPVFGGGTVAVKILHPERARNATTVERFRREAELLVRFSHPAIVKGLETGVVPPPKSGAPELHFLTMEHIDAAALDHLIEAQGALSPRNAIRITAQLAHGLSYLEKQGFLHRDIKPENVLVDRQCLARLCDLGLAVENALARGGAAEMAAGTAAYASPEQARGAADLDPASDIYSLGLTLFTMLTGKPPFAGETAEEILKNRFGEGRSGSPELSTVSAPSGVQVLLTRMLEPDRQQRLDNYPELLEALRHV